MPPAIIAAGIGAAASVGGAVMSGKAAKKAARTQAKAADSQIAATNANRDYQYNLNAPTIAQGNRAGDLFAGFLGAGGDAAASKEALDTFRGSTGYADLQAEGAAAVNSNVFARGLGNSGAAFKALQDRGASIANSSSGQWMSGLNTMASRGDQSRGLVAGIGMNSTNMNNGAMQNSADARSNATLVGAANTNNLIQGLLNAGAMAYGSSYKAPVAAVAPKPTWGQPGHSGAIPGQSGGFGWGGRGRGY